MTATQFQLRLTMFFLICLISCAGLWASEVTAVWEQTYHQATSDDQRYAIMLKIKELKDKDFAPLIAESLLKLNSSKIEAGDPSAVKIKLALATLMVQQLGDLRSLENADLVFDIYRNSKDPFLRGESALALGKMHATSAVEKMARDLADINLAPDLEKNRLQETLAYGLVQGLELMHAPEGFQPVFFASIGWYSGPSKVKETAAAALQTMIPDPSAQLKLILANETLLDRKLSVLNVTDQSNAPADAKMDIARVGLYQGLDVVTSDATSKRILSAIRMKSVKILVDNKDTAPATVPLYQRVVDLAFNVDELLTVYTALAKNGSPDAVAFLIKKMGDYNDRQKSKLNTDDDRRVIRQIIQSIGITKSPLAKQVLTDGLYDDHDGQVVRDIKLVLSQLQ